MRFIHLADVHLGAAPDKGCAWSSQREEEIWETFRRVITGIRENPVDLLFIAGDLFHRQPLLSELKEVNYLFSRIPQTNVYLIAGNHDYLRKDSMYHRISWAENVFFFRKEEVECIRDEKTGVYIYGSSFCHREIRKDILAGVKPLEEEGIHILLAHGGDAEHLPMDVKKLCLSGFDYLALGHIHKPSMLKRDKAIYCGALCPIDKNDLGRHGYVEGKAENGRIRTRFVPCAARSYEQILLEVTASSTQGELEEEARKEIGRLGEQNIYRIILKGLRSPDMLLIPEKFFSLGNISEVLNETCLDYDLDSLRRQYTGTLVGDFICRFTGRKLSPVEEKALYYGLQALLETSR